MSQLPADAYRARREGLPAGVSARLREAGISATFGPLERYYDFYGSRPDGLTGLVVRQPAGQARMQVTVVRVRRVVPPGQGGLSGGREWVRDLDVDYDLDADGDVLFEVTTLEDLDAGLGHSRATPAMRRLTYDDQAVADAVRLWHGYRESLRCVPPAPHLDRQRARLIRQIAARRAAAAVAQVRVTAAAGAVAPPQRPILAAHLAQLDHGLLCFHFPRDLNGRYTRRAVAALAGYGTSLGRRGPWLAVRADGDTLVAGVEELIGDNQDHRWDNTPWLWNTTHRNASAGQRWQLPGAAHARPIVALLDQHAVAEALTVAGVDADTDIAALLAGYPTCYLRGGHTETWVNRLYAQLRISAPWRFPPGTGSGSRNTRRRAGQSTGP